VGTATILIAGMAALTEIDIKKIVALSTLSQLGVIMTSVGAGHTAAAFLHLVLHAFFKAILFISVGFIIHGAADYQDTRKVSLPSQTYPIIMAVFLGANFRLCGLPFMRGFFSKDMCIELSLRAARGASLMVWFFLATSLTRAYTVRLALMGFGQVSKNYAFD